MQFCTDTNAKGGRPALQPGPRGRHSPPFRRARHRPGKLQLVPGDLEAEARQTMENTGAALEAMGLALMRCSRSP